MCLIFGRLGPRAHCHPPGCKFLGPCPLGPLPPRAGRFARVSCLFLPWACVSHCCLFCVFASRGAGVACSRAPGCPFVSFLLPRDVRFALLRFPFFASRSCVSLCLVAFVLAVPERPFRFFFVHPGECFPFFLSWHPGVCVSRCFFFAAPGRPVSPAPRRVRILFCLAPRRARLALWVFSHFQSCILSLPGQKKHLGKTPKHSNAKRTLRDDEK